LIAKHAEQKFVTIFGLIPGSYATEGSIPVVDDSIFRSQALWGPRGTHFGVSTCSNHIEGLHGRLNELTSPVRSLLLRLAVVISAIQKSAREWPERVMSGRRRAARDLIRHGCGLVECPAGDQCDHGDILSKRLGCRLPCVHIADAGFALDDDRPVFAVPDADEAPQVTVSEYVGEWTMRGLDAVLQESARLRDPPEAGYGPGQDNAEGPEAGFVERVHQEISLHNPRAQLPSKSQTLVRLGEIRGMLTGHQTTLDPRTLAIQANSQLFAEYAERFDPKKH
jgi:hypothetical protein